MAAMTHDQAPADIRRHRPKIHPELAKAIHWAIEPNRNERCPSMKHFLQTIRDIPEEDLP